MSEIDVSELLAEIGRLEALVNGVRRAVDHCTDQEFRHSLRALLDRFDGDPALLVQVRGEGAEVERIA